MKTVSELGELADATLKSDRAGIVDGVGDVIVSVAFPAHGDEELPRRDRARIE
jgi:NTP pyrophosphatase (non-canonical NTP hydrolase)